MTEEDVLNLGKLRKILQDSGWKQLFDDMELAREPNNLFKLREKLEEYFRDEMCGSCGEAYGDDV